MNISPDGVTVRFTTEPEELFRAEMSGAKPNTARLINANEKSQLEKYEPKKIIIQFQQEFFLRTITHVYVSEMILLEKYLAVFSWTNEDHQHVIAGPCKDDLLAHTMSLDQEPPIDTPQSVIRLPTPLIHELIALSGDGILPKLIERMIKSYTVPPLLSSRLDNRRWG